MQTDDEASSSVCPSGHGQMLIALELHDLF